MPRSVEALATPAVLKWARESSGLELSEAAQRLRIAEKRLGSWESGDGRPTVAQLRKLAELYRRPLAIFYLPVPPKKFEAMRDYRRMPGTSPRKNSAALMFEIRRARQRREVAIDLLQELGEPPHPFSLAGTRATDPIRLAATIRPALDVPMEEQFRWTQPYDALNGWKAAVERTGVLVFQMTGVRLSEARGYSESHRQLPFLLINTQDSPRGRVFTLIHELAHLVLRATGLCDLHEQVTNNRDADAVEVYCNRVAGAVLVPPHDLRAELRVREHQGLEWTGDELRSLADRYSVSREVMLRSLLAAGKTSQAFYERMRRDFLAEYDALAKQKRGGAVPHFRKVLAWNGNAYSRLVIDAYDEERITGSDLVDFLGVKMGELGKVRAALVSQEDVAV